jgi:hypothetical protein
VFTKYPRTPHLPWSPGKTKDDAVITTLEHLEQNPTIVTVKMDGENTTLYRNGLHARSLDYSPHPSRDWLRNLHAKIAHEIPVGWRICGENLYAKHAIHYTRLRNYFQVFSVWNEKNECLSWAETLEWCGLLELRCVLPLNWRSPGELTEKNVLPPYAGANMLEEGDECEGYVIRVKGQFHYDNFSTHVAKYVRADHVDKTVHNWMYQPITRNELE